MGAIAGAIVGGLIMGGSAKKAAKKADRAASQAAYEQELAIDEAEEKARIEEEELLAERQRIFDATQPQQESAQFTFGLQNRSEMGGFSDFISTDSPTGSGTDFAKLNTSTLLGGF